MKESKGKNIFRCFWPIIIVFLVQQAVAMMGMQFMMCWKAFTFNGGSYIDYIEGCLTAITSADFSTIIELLYAIPCAIIFGWWYAKVFIPKREGKRISLVKSLTQYHPMIIPGLLLFAIGMQYVCTYLMNAVAMQFPKWMMQYQQLMEAAGLDSESYSVLLILYAVIIGPICEELTFRGLTLGYARRAMPFWAANILQAFLFAAMHMNMIQGCYTFVVGLALGYIFYKSGNILLTIILHILFNLVGTMGNSLIVMGSTPVTLFAILLGALVATYAGYELIVHGLVKRVNNSSDSADMNSTM